jgi:hypothetical protein
MSYTIKQYGPTGHEAAFVLGQIEPGFSGDLTVELGFVPSKVVIYSQDDDTSQVVVMTWLNYSDFAGMRCMGTDDGTSDAGFTWTPGGTAFITAFEGDPDTGAGFIVDSGAGFASDDHIYFEAWR